MLTSVGRGQGLYLLMIILYKEWRGEEGLYYMLKV